MKKHKIIMIHALSFLSLTIALFLTSEILLEHFASAYYTLRMWLDLIIFGTIGIFMLTAFSCMVFLEKYSL